MGSSNFAVRLWRRTSLMQRLGFVALVPTLVTAVLLVTTLTRHQLTTVRVMAQDTANAIAIQAAAVSAEPLRQSHRRELARIAQATGDLPHVALVQIRSVDGEILAGHHDTQTGGTTGGLTVIREVIDPHRPLGPALGSVLVRVSLADAIAAQRSSLHNALITLAISLLVAGIIGWQVARWLSAPLRRLVAAVQQLGHGDAPVAVEITDRTEIGQLQRGFNAASAALFDMHRDMEREIDQATRALADKNAALEATSVAKARFLAAASHDLRQPLYALTLFSSALAVDEDDVVRLDRIAHIQECVQALDHLFSELLDLSRLETGTMEVEISDFSLDQVFDEVSRNFRMIAEQHDLRLVMRTTDVWVRSDRTMLGRILNNLVSNALRYTPEGGVLVAARRRSGNQVRVDVWDTGIGIAAEHQARVFDEFYRVENHCDAAPSDGPRRGLGLGLSTVQRLAELIGSDVQLHSRPHRGSVFSFVLSEVAPQAHADPLAAMPLDVSGMRVLVVDDEPAILSGIRYLLRSWGCDVATAEDGAQALDAVEHWRTAPDLVISDLHLRHGESGLEVLALLDAYYKREGARPFARLLITGETRRDRLQPILTANIPLLYKPVSPAQLRESLMAVWASIREGT